MVLIFVYNADGSFGATLRDTVKKIATPHAQECNLCAITYPMFAMDNEWSAFTKSLPHDVTFLHRDEFRSQHPEQKNEPLPAVFAQDQEGLHVLIPAKDINKARDIEDLKALVRTALALS